MLVVRPLRFKFKTNINVKIKFKDRRSSTTLCFCMSQSKVILVTANLEDPLFLKVITNHLYYRLDPEEMLESAEMYLYNVKSDPTETTDIKTLYPEIVQILK